ncbi:MAG: NAD-dependent protein deacylase [Clostridiales bacterium]|nr:NAD-dependent protein deacylase [Clostridiales bacterium]
MDKLETLRQWVAESQRIVFFGGAGVSTESGIPDFRSVDGLYQQQYAYPPETILSRSFFDADPAEFFRFYRQKLLHPDARPNPAHLTLARWEAEGRLSAVITQNIDGLHQAAGSKRVLELHGSVWRNRCMDCGREYPLSHIQAAGGIPRCACGGIVKPDVVLYEEPLDQRVTGEASRAIAAADLLVIGGTSLAVYPAAGLVRLFDGRRLVVINKSPTPMDNAAGLLIQDSIGRTLGAL